MSTNAKISYHNSVQSATMIAYKKSVKPALPALKIIHLLAAGIGLANLYAKATPKIAGWQASHSDCLKSEKGEIIFFLVYLNIHIPFRKY